MPSSAPRWEDFHPSLAKQLKRLGAKLTPQNNATDHHPTLFVMQRGKQPQKHEWEVAATEADVAEVKKVFALRKEAFDEKHVEVRKLLIPKKTAQLVLNIESLNLNDLHDGDAAAECRVEDDEKFLDCEGDVIPKSEVVVNREGLLKRKGGGAVIPQFTAADFRSGKKQFLTKPEIEFLQYCGGDDELFGYTNSGWDCMRTKAGAGGAAGAAGGAGGGGDPNGDAAGTWLGRG